MYASCPVSLHQTLLTGKLSTLKIPLCPHPISNFIYYFLCPTMTWDMPYFLLTAAIYHMLLALSVFQQCPFSVPVILNYHLPILPNRRGIRKASLCTDLSLNVCSRDLFYTAGNPARYLFMYYIFQFYLSSFPIITQSGIYHSHLFSFIYVINTHILGF